MCAIALVFIPIPPTTQYSDILALWSAQYSICKIVVSSQHYTYYLPCNRGIRKGRIIILCSPNPFCRLRGKIEWPSKYVVAPGRQLHCTLRPSPTVYPQFAMSVSVCSPYICVSCSNYTQYGMGQNKQPAPHTRHTPLISSVANRILRCGGGEGRGSREGGTNYHCT